jgi:voltage-gated potassium channel Kch
VEGFVLIQTAIGSALLIFTVVVHCAFTIAIVSLFGGSRILHRHRERIAALAGLVLMMFLASLIEASAWAITYVVIDAIPNLEKALYFSMVTFTTLGYGDITLTEDWRLLAAFEAANGSIMFGWTTAIVVAVIHSFFSQRE